MSVDMKANVTIHRKIIVNGKKYASIEEMPAEVREGYLQAMSSPARFSKTRILINGKEYRDMEEIPPDVRALYEKSLAAMKAASPSDLFGEEKRKPNAPRGLLDGFSITLKKDPLGVSFSASWRDWLIPAIGILLLLILFYSLR